MKKMILFFVFASLLAGSGLLAQQQETPVLQIIAQSQDAMEQQDFARASSLIQNALARHPESEGLQLQQARLYTYQKRDRQAIDLVNVLLRKNPASRDARLTLAQIYGYRRNYTKSDTLYRGLLSVDPADEAAALGLIHNLVLEDKLADARHELGKALKLHPDSLRLQQYGEYLVQADAAPESTPERVRRIQAGESFFSDNSGNRSLASSQGMSYDLGRSFSTRFRMDETSLWKTTSFTANVLSGTEDLRFRISKYFALHASGGGVRFADTASQPVYSGDAEFDPVRGLSLSGGYSRFSVMPTFDAAQFDLLAEGWHGRFDYRVHNFSLNGNIFLNRYSDGNRAEREYGELMKWLGGGKLSVGAGYATRHIRFEQQLNHGYFSPGQYWSHLGEAGVRVQIGRFYRGEYLGYLGAEREDLTPYNSAGQVVLSNEFFIRRWELDANYSRFQLAQATGAFQANMASIALGYRF